jgi:hypothetical protein
LNIACESSSSFKEGNDMIAKAAMEKRPYTICFIDREIPGFEIEKLKPHSSRSDIIVLTSESQLPEKSTGDRDIIFMRKPLKLSWLPDLINEALMKTQRT